MERMTSRDADRLANMYLENPNNHYLIYNIRRRQYMLHDPYTFYYRFSRRQAVWNTPVMNIKNATNDSKNVEKIAQTIYVESNKYVEELLAGNLKSNFTLDDCQELLAYYFNAKCYMAYYDSYLGRIVLIKERDKSYDFIELVGARYHFIGNLHDIIQNELGLRKGTLAGILTQVLEENVLISDIEHVDYLAEELHSYLIKAIDEIEDFLQSSQQEAEA